MRRGPIARAIIKRIAEERRIPYRAASFKYDCMSIARKRALGEQEQRRQAHAATMARDLANWEI